MILITLLFRIHFRISKAKLMAYIFLLANNK